MSIKVNIFFLIFFFSFSLFSKDYSFNDLYKLSLKKDPRMKEFKYAYHLLLNKLDKLDSVIYPKINYNLLVAPMAEIKSDEENLTGSIDDVDFGGKWGFIMNSRLSVIQPIYTFGKYSTAKEIGEKGILIAKKRKKKLKQEIKYDLIRAYNGLLMIRELEKIIADGKANLNKAFKRLQKLEMEDSDDYNESDLFKLRIQQRKLANKEAELNSVKEQIRFGLATLLGIEPNFKIKDKKLTKDHSFEKAKEFNSKKMLEYEMLIDLLEISKLNLSLRKRYFAPDIFIVADWYYKYTNVVPYKANGYNPYHANSPGIALGLRWNIDFFALKANYNKAKIELERTKARINYLSNVSKIKDKKIESELKFLNSKLKNLKVISKESKKWFTGNAMDYYVGIGEAKTLLTSLGAYLVAKTDVIRALYDYNLKVAEIKLFRGDL